jgi:vacuolar-type H+-ATPase subunit B/Vma2
MDITRQASVLNHLMNRSVVGTTHLLRRKTSSMRSVEKEKFDFVTRYPLFLWQLDEQHAVNLIVFTILFF